MLLGILKSIGFFLLVVFVALFSFGFFANIYRKRGYDDYSVINYTSLTLFVIVIVPIIIFEIYISLFAN